MNQNASAGWVRPLQMLRQLAQTRAVVEEVCDFCSARLAPSHRHLLEVTPRRIVCVCDPCALTFQGATGGRYKLVPRQVRRLADFRVTDAQWDSLALPINLAFLFHSSPQGKVVALYPSPAGVTESLLPLAHWQSLVKDNPILEQLEPDVEALLINRIGATREYYLAPIDWCFELTGVIRLQWRGLSGGTAVWKEIGSFFEKLRAIGTGSGPRVESGLVPPGPVTESPSRVQLRTRGSLDETTSETPAASRKDGARA